LDKKLQFARWTWHYLEKKNIHNPNAKFNEFIQQNAGWDLLKLIGDV